MLGGRLEGLLGTSKSCSFDFNIFEFLIPSRSKLLEF